MKNEMKIIVGIATTGNRLESLKLVIESLENNTIKPDEINIYDNTLEDVDYTDNGKFYFLKDYKEPVYYFTMDDDILYPETYIEDMINAIEKHKCIVTHHGRFVTKFNVNYYKGHGAIRCLSANFVEKQIDVAGTGVTAFRTDYFNPKQIYKSKYKRMSDCVFSLEAAKKGKTIMCLPHDKGYFKDLSKNQTDSCYTSEVKTDCKEQIEHTNKILTIKNENRRNRNINKRK
jgi:hypothetical protein